MFVEIFEKMSTFAKHHQAIIAMSVTFSVICISWGVEKILENYVFHKKPLHGYIIAIFGGLILLYLIQHFIMHAI